MVPNRILYTTFVFTQFQTINKFLREYIQISTTLSSQVIEYNIFLFVE